MAEACSNCGIELPYGASFCAECGTAGPASEAPVPPPQPWPSAPPDQPPTPAEMPPLAPLAIAPDQPPLPAAPEFAPVGPPPVPQWSKLPPPPTTAGVGAGLATGFGPGAAARPTSPRATAGASRNMVAGVLGVVGALVLGVSSFLAWAEVTLSVVADRTQTVTGWDWFDNGIDTGPVFAVLALGAAGLAGLVIAQVTPLAIRITVVAVGGLSLGLAAFAISDILGRKSDLEAVGQVDITLQYGIWLLVAGALLILASGLVAQTRPGPAPA